MTNIKVSEVKKLNRSNFRKIPRSYESTYGTLMRQPDHRLLSCPCLSVWGLLQKTKRTHQLVRFVEVGTST